jgi:hypothetical protein
LLLLIFFSLKAVKEAKASMKKMKENAGVIAVQKARAEQLESEFSSAHGSLV